MAAYARRRRSPATTSSISAAVVLGLYNRLRNQAACIDTIGRMVALRTVRDEKVPQHENPAVIAFGTLVEPWPRISA